MEPVTHLLTGACIGRAGLNRTTAYATLMLTLAAEFPDIDILWQIRGPVEAFTHHRGFTHSFLGAPVDAIIVLGFVYGLHRWRLSRGKSPRLVPRWGLLFLFGILAVLSHILLDFTNNYGVRPFMPFNWRWYSWDIVFIIEPLMLLVLLVGLVLPSIFGLVGREIGAGKERFHGRWCAVGALLAVCAIWWMRDYEHRKAVTLLNSTDYRGEVVSNAGAMPYPLTPFFWGGIVETQSFYAKIPIDLRGTNLDPQDRAQIFYKPAETPITLAAKRSPLGRAYLDWARFPLLEAEPLTPPELGYEVRLRDLRFDYLLPSLGGGQPRRSPLGATVIVDHSGKVVLMRMGDREEKPHN
ncbi:MAG TPA: metal-dependent hydrolase [Terriglobales bacterium]|nr:metal-dependent hydrolase [Terriglobales bacterium]